MSLKDDIKEILESAYNDAIRRGVGDEGEEVPLPSGAAVDLILSYLEDNELEIRPIP